MSVLAVAFSVEAKEPALGVNTPLEPGSLDEDGDPDESDMLLGPNPRAIWELTGEGQDIEDKIRNEQQVIVTCQTWCFFGRAWRSSLPHFHQIVILLGQKTRLSNCIEHIPSCVLSDEDGISTWREHTGWELYDN